VKFLVRKTEFLAHEVDRQIYIFFLKYGVNVIFFFCIFKKSVLVLECCFFLTTTLEYKQ